MGQLVGAGAGAGAYVVKDDQLRRPPTVVIANGVKHAMPDNGGDELFEKQQQQHPTDDSEVEIMHFEQAIQLQRATLFHDLAAAEDDQVVGDQGCGGLRHGRHGGDALLEAPVFRFVAQQCVEGMGEDGPELVNEFQSSAVIREVGKGEGGCVGERGWRVVWGMGGGERGRPIHAHQMVGPETADRLPASRASSWSREMAVRRRERSEITTTSAENLEASSFLFRQPTEEVCRVS